MSTPVTQTPARVRSGVFVELVMGRGPLEKSPFSGEHAEAASVAMFQPVRSRGEDETVHGPGRSVLCIGQLPGGAYSVSQFLTLGIRVRELEVRALDVESPTTAWILSEVVDCAILACLEYSPGIGCRIRTG